MTQDALCWAGRNRNLLQTAFMFSPARETLGFQSCVRLNKKNLKNMSDSDDTLIHSNGSKATRCSLPKEYEFKITLRVRRENGWVSFYPCSIS